MAARSIARRIAAAPRVLLTLSLILASVAGLAAAQKYTEWTGWRMTDDPLIQWRTRTQDWGKNMSPVCEFEIRVGGEAATNFRWDVIFQPEGEGTNGNHRADTAYGVTRDQDFSATIGGCRVVNDVRVTRVVRRTAAPSSPTRQLPASDSEGRSARQGTEPTRRTERSIPDVIHFPGPRKPYRGPQLNAVRMDSHSLRSIRSASDRLQKALLDWRPVRVWAYGGAPTISQRDWDALARITARADKGTLRNLSADAARNANRYGSDDKLRRFWRSMADFYSHHGAK